MLYLSLDSNFIPLSGFQCYIYFCYTILYLLLLWLLLFFANLISDLLYLLLVSIFIPTSVISTSAFVKLDFRHVIPTSGIGKMDIIPSSVISTYGAPTQSALRNQVDARMD